MSVPQPVSERQASFNLVEVTKQYLNIQRRQNLVNSADLTTLLSGSGVIPYTKRNLYLYLKTYHYPVGFQLLLLLESIKAYESLICQTQTLFRSNPNSSGYEIEANLSFDFSLSLELKPNQVYPAKFVEKRQELRGLVLDLVEKFLDPTSENFIPFPINYRQQVVLGLDDNHCSASLLLKSLKAKTYLELNSKYYPKFLAQIEKSNLSSTSLSLSLLGYCLSLTLSLTYLFTLIFHGTERRVYRLVVVPLLFLAISLAFNVYLEFFWLYGLLGLRESSFNRRVKLESPYLLKLHNRKAKVHLVFIVCITLVITLMFSLIPSSPL